MVADEVRNLSQHSNRFSEQIAAVMKDAKADIAGAKQVVSGMASKDMTATIAENTRVDGMMDAVQRYNARTDETLAQVSGITSQISDSVARAVISLQFEDVVTQVVAYSEAHINRLRDLTHRMHEQLASMDGSDTAQDDIKVQQMLAQFSQEILAIKREWANPVNKAVSQDSMDEGDVELF